MSSATDLDQFELELAKFNVHSSTDVALLGQRLGLDGGGSWWLDLHEKPIEFDSDGHVIEGAVAEIESQVRTWLRHSFDNNPEFRGNSYHLLGRLNELARLQGLVEEVALKYHNSGGNLKTISGSRSYSSLRDSSHTHRLSDPAQPHRANTLSSEASSENYFNSGTFTKGTLEAPSFKRPPLPEAYQDVQRADDQLYSKNLALNRQFSRTTGLPHLHKSQQPPSPHHNQLQRSHLYNRRASVRTSNAPSMLSTSTDSPENLQVHSGHRTGVLNRTYSKEALDQLKADDILPTRRSGGSLLDNFLRASNHSGAGSDPEVNIDISKSVDSVGFAPNILSKSFTDGEISSLRASGMKANASFSSMKGANVLEMALFQESQLRKLSGSRGKLSGSNSSLTGSSVDIDGYLHPANLVTHSTDFSATIEKGPSTNTYKGIALRRRSSPQKRASQLNLNGTHPSSTSVLTEATEHQDVSKLGDLPNNSAESTALPVSEPPTPVVNMDSELITMKKDHGGPFAPTTVTYRHKHHNTFFPDISPTHAFDTDKQTDDQSRLNRLSSFERMEARVSQEHFMSGTLDDVVSGATLVASDFPTEHATDMPVSNVSSSCVSEKNDSRPHSKIPFYSARGTASVHSLTNPAPSKQLPTISVRSRAGPAKPSTFSSTSRSGSGQARIPSQLRNVDSRSAVSLTRHGDVQPPSSRPTGMVRPATKTVDSTIGAASNLSIPQPKTSLSNVSPVRSRRFGRGASDMYRSHRS